MSEDVANTTVVSVSNQEVGFVHTVKSSSAVIVKYQRSWNVTQPTDLVDQICCMILFIHL